MSVSLKRWTRGLEWTRARFRGAPEAEATSQRVPSCHFADADKGAKCRHERVEDDDDDEEVCM